MRFKSGKKKCVGRKGGDEKKSREPEIPLERFWMAKTDRRETTDHSCGGLNGMYTEGVQVICVYEK